MEYLFLEHTFRWLVEGGVLLMVVLQERLDSAIPLLAGNFTDLRIFRLTDPEAERGSIRSRSSACGSAFAASSTIAIAHCRWRWRGDTRCQL
jgi:hypothetical protein